MITVGIWRSTNFEFVVVAANEDDAYRLLLQAWRKHVAQTGAERTMMREALVDGEVTFHNVLPGTVLRDGSPLLTPNIETL